MHLTYIFGNGMDLQLGLPTSFSDFYKWADKEKKKNIFLPHNYDNINIESWSDFESIFVEIINDHYYCYIGQEDNIMQKEYIDYYKEIPLSYEPEQDSTYEFVEFIVDEFDELSLLLEEYLNIVDNHIKNHKNLGNIMSKIESDISNLTKLFNTDEFSVDRISKYINQSDSRVFNIATLNYTSTTLLLKKEIEQRMNIKFGVNSHFFSHKSSMPLYVHGKLEDENWDAGIVLGTFDTSVLHKDLQSFSSSKFLSKKDKIRTMMGRDDYNKFRNLFNSKRNIIVCYGVSFGESDKELLSIILQKANLGEAIILYYEFENSKKTLSRRKFKLKNNLLDKFSRSLDLEEETLDKISKNLIAIPINKKVNFLSNDNKFDINLEEE